MRVASVFLVLDGWHGVLMVLVWCRMKPLSPISPGSEGTRVKFEGSDYDLDKMSEVEEEDKAAYPIAEAV